MTNGTSRNRKRLSNPEGSRSTHQRAAPESLPYSSVAENTRAHTRTGRDSKRKTVSKGTKANGQRRNVKASNVDNSHDVDVEMKAAATLTRLLHHSRNSITSLSAVSPRSSLSAGSDVGSSHSHSQFAQSSARTTTAQTSLASSQESPHIARPATPPRSSGIRLTSRTNSFPEGGSASATDQEAIKLLYFLHESPSPARPSTVRSRDSQDAALHRTLSDNSDLQAQGRVLFPSASGGHSDIPLAYRMLTRDNSGSSISSTTAMEIPPSRPLKRELTLVIDPPVGDVELPQHSDPPIRVGDENDVPPVTKVIPPTPIESPQMTQLLPPPSSPQRTLQTSSSTQPASPLSEHKAHHAAPATPGTYTFNLNDFINVSPSPAGPHRTTAPYKQNLSGIRSGGGRKLFAEEQAEQLIGVEETSRMGEHPNTALGAGIHLTRF